MFVKKGKKKKTLKILFLNHRLGLICIQKHQFLYQQVMCVVICEFLASYGVIFKVVFNHIAPTSNNSQTYSSNVMKFCF